MKQNIIKMLTICFLLLGCFAYQATAFPGDKLTWTEWCMKADENSGGTWTSETFEKCLEVAKYNKFLKPDPE